MGEVWFEHHFFDKAPGMLGRVRFTPSLPSEKNVVFDAFDASRIPRRSDN